MNETHRNYLKFQAEMNRRGEVAYKLRFALFALSTLAVAALIWLGICHAAPTVLRHVVDEGARWDAEHEGLQEAYDAEAFDGLMRAAEQLREGDAE